MSQTPASPSRSIPIAVVDRPGEKMLGNDKIGLNRASFDTTQPALRKPGWIDFDAGQVLEGVSMDAAADKLMKLVIETASGKATKAELNGEREIAIWKSGVTL